MAPKAAKAKKPVAGDPNDPDGMCVWSRRYLEALRVKGYSERTVDNRDHYLGPPNGARLAASCDRRR